MRTRVGLVAACAAALAVASCGPQVGLERGSAATQRSRSTARSRTAAVERSESQDRATPDVMRRWNASAGASPAVALNNPPGFAPVRFLWTDHGFPHPTYAGGSREAYGAFAETFVAFLQAEGNFDFLAGNDSFTAPLPDSVAPGGRSQWTFLGLAEDFSNPDAFGAKFGTHGEATRKALAEFARKMKAPRKV
jgi:hypothetical protein